MVQKCSVSHLFNRNQINVRRQYRKEKENFSAHSIWKIEAEIKLLTNASEWNDRRIIIGSGRNEQKTIEQNPMERNAHNSSMNSCKFNVNLINLESQVINFTRERREREKTIVTGRAVVCTLFDFV